MLKHTLIACGLIATLAHAANIRGKHQPARNNKSLILKLTQLKTFMTPPVFLVQHLAPMAAKY